MVRKVGGTRFLTLGRPNGGTLAVPEEWTDQAAPREQGAHQSILDFANLLELADLLASLNASRLGRT